MRFSVYKCDDKNFIEYPNFIDICSISVLLWILALSITIIKSLKFLTVCKWLHKGGGELLNTLSARLTNYSDNEQ